ncbi:MAG: 2-dehydropantoate 2-reductase [Flavipsychrobacter sp.]|nr:2-dehydropantoate 2-reductase [Flavipsychrobacter sp.]
MAKTKIVIAGIGGVGGYFGGLLAQHYHYSKDVDVYFLARGEHLKEIQANGLTVVKGDTRFSAIPKLATDNPADIGVADFIIVCTKSYDLEKTVEQLGPCINNETIILPLLNGVDSRERIKNILPHNLVLDGCVYIVARIVQAGVVENAGNIQALYFGSDNFEDKRLQLLESIFRDAGIEATRSQNILQVLWEKYIFISPTATATSFFNNSIGALVTDDEKLKTVTALVEEVKQLANAKQVRVSEDITEKSINKLKAMPFEATSSLHRDFKDGKANTELDSLTGFVVQMSKMYNLNTPVYDQVYEQLKNR